MAIAELNLARRRYDFDDPRFADFMDNLDRVNALAERSDGFIWRLKGDGNDATDLAVADDPLLIVNLSTWESLAALDHFVFATIHRQFYARRSEWFPAMETRHFVMWEVAADHRPTLDEALERLAELERTGPSDRVFGWEALSGGADREAGHG